MAGFNRSVIVNRPIEAVFDFAADINFLSKMMPSVTRAEMATEGGMKPGARIRETRRMNGKERTVVVEVVEYQHPEIYSVRSAMMGMAATYRFRFFPDPAGTRVELDADVQGNFLWWPFLGMLSRMMAKEDGDFLDRLKEAMQAEK